ncbi:hypothetical protein KPL39_04380 [Clostridium gasigenes]|uniref:hypothetical protein n=1 Tax=Clostridium gasigenes TaxID=94869 RepID=UPI001C0D9426|nr:hypothetical protein [Clostridium gasigenes]MBU3135500.1 hypothetical protein [Clostridium gasigenes]
MKRKVITIVLSIILLLIPINSSNTVIAITKTTYEELAQHWSPVLRHAVDITRPESDSIAKFNYDGDWIGNNNWNNRDSFPMEAYVYYGVQETTTHYFITYGFFHPRDDSSLSIDRHENDFEGILSVIKKDETLYGTMVAMESQAHGQQYQYKVAGSEVENGHENIDGTLIFNVSNPEVFIEAGGHGAYAWKGDSAPGGNGIVYKYTGIADVPSNMSGNYQNQYGYNLVKIDEIWDRREDVGGSGHTFQSFGRFDGDDFKADSANSPWNWDDSDDGANFNGMIISDPAYYIDQHLNGLDNFSHTYIDNQYYTHKITIEAVTPLVKSEGIGMGNPDLYLDIIIAGEKYVDPWVWKKNECAVNSFNKVRWGFDNSQEYGQFSEEFNTIYVAKPMNSLVEIKLWDSDSTASDFMGSINVIPKSSEIITLSNATTSNGQGKITATIQAK